MAAGAEPGVEFGGVGVDAGTGAVLVAVDGQSFALLPKLDGADVAVEVGGDFLPGVDTRDGVSVGRVALGAKRATCREGHTNSPQIA